MEEPESIKVVLLGESGVGKTSIISQFTTNKFDPRCQSSVSAQFISKMIDFPEYKKTIKFDIWDTVGQEKYRSLAKIFYKDAKIIIFVYDITSEFTFNSLKDFWYKESINNADNDPIFAVVANKIDLYKKQVIDNRTGKAYADEINAIFQTTSAMSNSGINTLFDHLGKKFINPDYDYKLDEEEKSEKYLKRKKEKNEDNNNQKKEAKGLTIKIDNDKEIKKNCCK